MPSDNPTKPTKPPKPPKAKKLKKFRSALADVKAYLSSLEQSKKQ